MKQIAVQDMHLFNSAKRTFARLNPGTQQALKDLNDGTNIQYWCGTCQNWHLTDPSWNAGSYYRLNPKAFDLTNPHRIYFGDLPAEVQERMKAAGKNGSVECCSIYSPEWEVVKTDPNWHTNIAYRVLSTPSVDIYNVNRVRLRDMPEAVVDQLKKLQDEGSTIEFSNDSNPNWRNGGYMIFSSSDCYYRVNPNTSIHNPLNLSWYEMPADTQKKIRDAQDKGAAKIETSHTGKNNWTYDGSVRFNSPNLCYRVPLNWKTPTTNKETKNMTVNIFNTSDTEWQDMPKAIQDKIRKMQNTDGRETGYRKFPGERWIRGHAAFAEPTHYYRITPDPKLDLANTENIPFGELPKELQDAFRAANPKLVEYRPGFTGPWQLCFSAPCWSDKDIYRLPPTTTTKETKNMMNIDPLTYNSNGTVFGLLPDRIQRDLRAVDNGKNIEHYTENYAWVLDDDPDFYADEAYRLKPGWKPIRIELVKPFLDRSCTYRFKSPHNSDTPTLSNAPSVKGFKGYMYGSDCVPILQSDLAGGVRLPDAVKFELVS